MLHPIYLLLFIHILFHNNNHRHLFNQINISLTFYSTLFIELISVLLCHSIAGTCLCYIFPLFNSLVPLNSHQKYWVCTRRFVPARAAVRRRAVIEHRCAWLCWLVSEWRRGPCSSRGRRPRKESVERTVSGRGVFESGEFMGVTFFFSLSNMGKFVKSPICARLFYVLWYPFPWSTPPT